LDRKEDAKPADTLMRRLWLYLTRTGEGERADDTRRQIEEILDEVEEKGIIDEDQGDMIHNILFLRDTTASEIMVPKGDIVALSVDADLDDAARVFTEEGYSRVPVYEGTMDNIVGILHAKDLLRYWKDRDDLPGIRSLLHEPFFVPEGKRLTDLIKEFREKRTKIAIVIDEYGGVDGMVTVADVMEEIIGDAIGEEGDDFEGYVEPLGEGLYAVDPKMPVDEFAETFGISVPEGDYDTVAGFVTSSLQRIPRVGELFEHAGVVLEIAGADRRRISKLVVRVPGKKDQA